MNDFINVIAIVEGRTEEIFINSLLAPYLADKKIYMTATQVSKSGQKGGDVKFGRVKKDLETHLKQRSETFITTLVDFYGVKEWPGIDNIPPFSSPSQIAAIVNDATYTIVVKEYFAQRADVRFIPYISIHEFEALLFSDSTVLAEELEIDEKTIIRALSGFSTPEAINNSPSTAPSKRLDGWSKNNKFPKTTKGIAVATKIGIQKMREKCPQFNAWIKRMEAIVENQQ